MNPHSESGATGTGMGADDLYVAAGRCRSGRRWFWIAVVLYAESAHKCDDPVCIYGGPHEYGWEDTEDMALSAMNAAATRLGRNPEAGSLTGNTRTAAGALKQLNAAKRAARRPSGDKGAGVVEYLYAAYSSSWIDDMTGRRDQRVIAYQITRKTAKRIHYIRRKGTPEWNEPPVIGYISRDELAADTRCPGGGYPDLCEHGHQAAHGDGPGEIRTSRYHDYDYHLFASREAAENYLFRWERERERETAEREPEVKRLRMAMADAHPDRGGTAEAFIAARKRYERALRRVS